MRTGCRCRSVIEEDAVQLGTLQRAANLPASRCYQAAGGLDTYLRACAFACLVRVVEASRGRCKSDPTSALLVEATNVLPDPCARGIGRWLRERRDTRYRVGIVTNVSLQDVHGLLPTVVAWLGTSTRAPRPLHVRPRNRLVGLAAKPGYEADHASLLPALHTHHASVGRIVVEKCCSKPLLRGRCPIRVHFLEPAKPLEALLVPRIGRKRLRQGRWLDGDRAGAGCRFGRSCRWTCAGRSAPMGGAADTESDHSDRSKRGQHN